MDKGGILYGDDGTCKQSVDDHERLSAAQDLGAEEKFDKRDSYHYVHLVSERNEAVLSGGGVGGKRDDTSVFSVPVQQILSLQVV